MDAEIPFEGEFSLELLNPCLNCHAGSCAEHSKGGSAGTVSQTELEQGKLAINNMSISFPVELQIETVGWLHPRTIFTYKHISPLKELWQTNWRHIIRILLRRNFREAQLVFPFKVGAGQTTCPDGWLFGSTARTADYFLFLELIEVSTKALVDFLQAKLYIPDHAIPEVRSVLFQLWRIFGRIPGTPRTTHYSTGHECMQYFATLGQEGRKNVLDTIGYLSRQLLSSHPYVWQAAVPQALKNEMVQLGVLDRCVEYLMIHILRTAMWRIWEQVRGAAGPPDARQAFNRINDIWDKALDLPYPQTDPMTMIDVWTYDIAVVGVPGAGSFILSPPLIFGIDMLNAFRAAALLNGTEVMNWKDYWDQYHGQVDSWDIQR